MIWLAAIIALIVIAWMISGTSTGVCAACGKPSEQSECDDCADAAWSAW